MIKDIPTDTKTLLPFANQLIEQCRVSSGQRAAYYRLLNTIAETGKYDGTKSLVNKMNSHLERTAAHLFSPVELKFAIDFDNMYPPEFVRRGEVAAKHLTRDWERAKTGILFGRGVFEGLKYGASLLKQWSVDEMGAPKFKKKLVMPWNFGVYREDENDIDEQEALCETSILTMPEVWQRIWNLPEPDKLYDRIKANAQVGTAGSQPDSFFHQVLSTSQLNTGVQGMTRPLPGGIVQLNNDPNYAIMGPSIAAETVIMHELWIKGEHDYVTVQVVEPDVLVSGRFKLANLLIKDSRMHPYTKIQPNENSGWFWGRSELVDLIEPQGLLSQFLEDLKRLVGQQIDKILGFTGESGMTDELYAQFRTQGWANLGVGADIKDVTPKFPAELLPVIKFLLEQIDELGSFPNIMRGQGEAGVRSGAHAGTLMKTASPTLRDRALLVEGQCADAADLTFELMKAKDPSFYWTKADEIKDTEETKFLLAAMPEDSRVTVDSHSSSPIFADEAQQIIGASTKLNITDGEYFIDNMPMPNKEVAKAALREKMKRQSQLQEKLLTQLSPEGKDKAIENMLKGHGRH